MIVRWPAATHLCLLHGMGSSGQEFREHWGALAEGSHCTFLDGPEIDRLTGKRRWFAFSGRATALAAGVERAADGVEAAVAHLDDLVLAGHSQGAMICLELLRRGSLHIRAVCSFAGALPAPLRIAVDRRRQSSAVHMFWSRADRFVAPAEVEATAAFFAGLPGSTVHRHVSRALSHAFSADWLDERNFEEVRD